MAKAHHAGLAGALEDELDGERRFGIRALLWGLLAVLLINGAVGLVIAPRGRLFRILRFTFAEGRISEINVIGDRTTMADLDLAVLDH